jgi:MFS family permease
MPDSAADRRYANYVLAILFLVYVFNFIDRTILSILVEDVKRDLGVSDTAMGFLTGIAFALFYTIAGIPIARWADVGVRRSIIALGLLVWSLMTAASGLAQNYGQLVAARIGVGVGEAAGSPPAHSLLADYFPPERRATVLSLYSSGIYVGVLFGYLAGGWVNEFFGWRQAFFVVGLPGVALALLVRFSIREPPRGHSERVVEVAAPEPWQVVFRFLWSLPSFRHLAFGAGMAAFSGYGFAQWAPTFLRRVHDMGSGEVGTWLGLIIGFGGLLGAPLGGWLADRWGGVDVRWYAWIPGISAVVGIPFALCFLLIDSVTPALLVYIPAVVFSAMYLGPTLAMIQAMVKLRMRAMASAVLFLILNLIGLGLGPQAVGALSDLLKASYGDEALRYALVIVSFSGLWAAIHYALAARTLANDLQAKNR